MDKKENIILIISGILLAVLLTFIFLESFKFGLIILIFLLFLFLLVKSGKLSFNDIPLLLLFASVLFPPIRFKSSPYIRPELILILIAWILLFLGRLAKGESIKLRWTPTHKWFFIFGVSILVSILWAWIFKGFSPSPRDFFEIAKLMEYFLIFAFVTNLSIKRENFKKYYILTICIFLIAAIFAFVQRWNLFPNFNESFIEYVAPKHLDEWLGHRRIVGTTGNPNEFGMLMAIASSLAIIGILWIKRIDIKIFSFLSFAIFSFTITLTFSRSALIVFLINLLFILFLKYPKRFGLRGKTRLVFLIFPMIIILGLIIIQIAPPKFISRAISGLSIETDVSFQNRLDIWRNNVNIWKQSPIFGWGPGKDAMTTIVDNEWLLLLRRYGIVGVIIFIILTWNFYSGLGRVPKQEEDNLYLEIFSVFLQTSLVSIAVYMIPAAFYHSLQLMPILMTLLGLVYSQSNRQLTTEYPKLKTKN